MSLELRHLRAVCAIADAGSVSRAATVLGTSQPALTAQLQRIERVLGGRLFTRGRHGVTPTPLGAYVLERSRILLIGMEELLAGATARPSGTIRLGGVAGPILPGLVELLGAGVSSYADDSPQLLCDLVAAGRLDAAVVADYREHELRPPPPLRSAVMAEEPIFMAVPETHPLAVRDEIGLAELAGEAFVLSPSDGGGWPECFLLACMRAGFAPRTPHQAADGWVIRSMVTTGGAVAPCRATFAESPGLVIRPLTGTPLTMRHLLVWHPHGTLAERSEEVIGYGTRLFSAYALDRPRYVEWLGLRRESDDARPDRR
ncbi:LysR family transcriptional regulator [Nonomuraea soli]|uniref:DNA-binding transcriptional LysR family regulator n=1 Tax=Nonomuraea soli TaxID=1032476 RepID=A0A7W0CCS3_9ACTN|nr:LysR family transcriptional regulator [Nonomuraea soli]MBA2888751.1 DNA-binding transcriptional LysR family regulator [Nonomuraea soli]